MMTAPQTLSWNYYYYYYYYYYYRHIYRSNVAVQRIMDYLGI